MDPETLARIQFALTIGFHFIFPPLTIGMAWVIFYFMTRYKKTGQELYARQVKFWLKLFAITFAVGVATGITMEFEFGTNWAQYSRFVGDIFGAPLAAEGILAFFLESTFMGVLLFGWKRFSKRVLWIASLLVAVGATLSAFWIIVANSWMQTPAGFEVIEGRAVLTDFWAATFNPSTIPRYLHTMVACLTTGAFFVMAISAWYLWKGVHKDFARQALKVSLVFAFLSSVAQPLVGHYHAVQVWETQPIKMAAFEGLFETEESPALAVFGIPNPEEREVDFAIGIPGFLPIFLTGDPDTEVLGLNEFPEDQWPPVRTTFFSFHLMTMLGMYFAAFTGLGLFLLWRKRLYQNKLFMKLAFFSLPLPIIANELGWMAAEVGRQPWIVYPTEGFAGMRTSEAFSPTVPAGEILASIIMFTVIYALLFVLWVYLLRKHVRLGPPAAVEGEAHQAEVSP